MWLSSTLTRANLTEMLPRLSPSAPETQALGAQVMVVLRSESVAIFPSRPDVMPSSDNWVEGLEVVLKLNSRFLTIELGSADWLPLNTS